MNEGKKGRKAQSRRSGESYRHDRGPTIPGSSHPREKVAILLGCDFAAGAREPEGSRYEEAEERL